MTLDNLQYLRTAQRGRLFVNTHVCEALCQGWGVQAWKTYLLPQEVYSLGTGEDRLADNEMVSGSEQSRPTGLREIVHDLMHCEQRK